MRRDARARILSKRMAAAASTSAIAKQEIQDTGGRNQRVVKRAKRDCRVTDARRQRLGPVLFQGEDAIHGLCSAQHMPKAISCGDLDLDALEWPFLSIARLCD